MIAWYNYTPYDNKVSIKKYRSIIRSMSMPIRLMLGKRIRELRLRHQYTQEELSEYADVDYKYIQRIEGIENAAKEVAGNKIEEVYAIKAGREIRIIVKPNLVSDDEAKVMAKDIAEEIEKKQSYPGNVEVTVIRETRAVGVAK